MSTYGKSFSHECTIDLTDGSNPVIPDVECKVYFDGEVDGNDITFEITSIEAYGHSVRPSKIRDILDRAINDQYRDTFEDMIVQAARDDGYQFPGYEPYRDPSVGRREYA